MTRDAPSVRPSALQCCKCGEFKPDAEFNRDATKPARRQRQGQCRTCKSASDKDYHKANRDARVAASRRRYLNNRPARLEYAFRYDEANPQRRLARDYTAKGGCGPIFKITPREVRRLKASPCAYCGEPTEHLDHVIPKVGGGSHGIGNLISSCARCNDAKYRWFLSEWRYRGGRRRPLYCMTGKSIHAEPEP